MGRGIAVLSSLIAAGGLAQAFAQSEPGDAGFRAAEAKVVVTDFVGTIEFRRADLNTPSVEIQSAEDHDRFGVLVENMDRGLRVSMAPPSGNISCVTQNSLSLIQVAGSEPTPLEDLPHVIVAVPASVDVELSMIAGVARIGRIENLDAELGGCAELAADRVSRRAALSVSAGAKAEVDFAGALDLRGDGGARASVASLAGLSSVELSGGARLTVSEIHGSLTARQKGASRIVIDGGELDALDLETARVSRFSFGGVTGAADLSLADASRVSIGSAQRPVTIKARGRASRLTVGGEVIAGL